MNNTKVCKLLKKLEEDSCQICLQADNFVDDFLKWADELQEEIEKKSPDHKESPIFQLPKTPSDKKTRNRKARNALVSKCSVLNSTVYDNDVIDFNDTIATRTRAARRKVSSSLSITVTKENREIIKIGSVEETQIVDISNELPEKTFVVPPTTSTRTKPVYKNKEQENLVSECLSSLPARKKTKLLRSSSESSTEKLNSTRHTSKSVKESPAELETINGKISERTVIKEIYRTHSKSPTEGITEKKSALGDRSFKRLSGSELDSPADEPSRRKISRTVSGSPAVRTSRSIISSPPMLPSSSRSTQQSSRSPAIEGNTLTERNSDSITNRTISIKKEISQSVGCQEENTDLGEKMPVNLSFARISKTSTPFKIKKSPETKATLSSCEDVGNMKGTNVTYDVAETSTENSEDNPAAEKKRKGKKTQETSKENIESAEENIRVTRTKTKALKQMMEDNEDKQADVSAAAKKILNRAKMTSLRKSHLTALLENNVTMPQTQPKGGKISAGNFASKYHLLLSSSKKGKTPLATLPNSAVKILKPSGDKGKGEGKIAKRDSSVENAPRTASKLLSNDEALEKEIKLKSKQKRKEEAAIKRQIVIKAKQEELKRKNELKHQLAMKQREKLQQEKYNNMIQSEKEKEERLKLILQERLMKIKEEAFMKKMMTQQKIAETNERRRLEEEARIAKLKEQEAEEQRLALEKQREQERQEKRAQERLAQKKAREEYEQQMKQELEAERIKAEKMSKKHLQSASKIQSASKRPKFMMLGEKKEWDYKPRSENDYGLEDEHSEVESDEERNYEKAKPPVPWAERVISGKCPLVKTITLQTLSEYMACYQKTPDLHKMFKMTPTKRIKRTSSAIWNTPNS